MEMEDRIVFVRKIMEYINKANNNWFLCEETQDGMLKDSRNSNADVLMDFVVDTT